MKKIALLLTMACGSALAQDGWVAKPINQDSLNAFAKVMLDEDSAFYLKGSEALIGESIPDVTASKLISDYQGNELSADKKYKDKSVRIKTVASAIKSDVGGRGFIVANGANAYSNAYLYVNEKDERILSLNKGSKIDFICYGNGMILDTPILKLCVFTSDFTKEIVGRIEKNISRASEVNYKPQSYAEFRVTYFYKAYESEIGEACLKSSAECIKSFKLAIKRDEKELSSLGQEKFKAVAEKYKHLPRLPNQKKSELLKMFE